MICGVGQACIFNNIPFAIVSYRDWKEYNNYKVIIVPSARFMADSEVVQLGDFMRAGGTLIWCEECGMGDCYNLISFFLRLQTVRCFLLTLRGDRRKWPRKFIKALLHTNPVIQPQHGHSFKNSHRY